MASNQKIEKLIHEEFCKNIVVSVERFPLEKPELFVHKGETIFTETHYLIVKMKIGKFNIQCRTNDAFFSEKGNFDKKSSEYVGRDFWNVFAKEIEKLNPKK